jgi:putative SOS response-associated peptidase YedK
MCGRFSLIESERVKERFGVQVHPKYEYRPNYNVAPGQHAPVITCYGYERMYWGLVPAWASDPKQTGYSMINAKAETVAEKPTYRRPLRYQRCLVPASGFYEWLKVDGQAAKVPHYFKLKTGDYFAFAGLYDVRKDAEGQDFKSFTIITTEPNSLVAQVHDRMPVMLSRDEERDWLRPDLTEPAELLPMLDSYPTDEMEAYPVSSLVGSVRNNGPDLIAPESQQ